MTCTTDWDHDDTICGQCQGNGCGTCGGSGEVPREAQLLHVLCACGWECDGRAFAKRMETSDVCPDCRAPIAEQVDEQRPEEPDLEPDFDGPDDDYEPANWREYDLC